MEQYIPKSALIAEIEKHFKYATNGIEYAQMGIDRGLEHYKEELAIWQHCQSMCHHILSFVNSLEVKEVDFEKNLTWEDMFSIFRLVNEVLDDYAEGKTKKEVGEEVLRRFKVQKGE